jgi:ATP-binding cassette subfamily A (ABC1) protein 3
LRADFPATFLAIILAIGALLSPSSVGVQIILTLIFPPMFYTFFTKALASYENIPLTPDYIRTSPNGDAPVIALLVVAIVRSHPLY